MRRSGTETLRQLIREMAFDGAGQRTIRVGDFPISVEVALTPEEQSLGLMHRQHLEPDCGMLFGYDEPQELSFWMRDTHIPLSIAFIDDEGRIIAIRDMEPHDESHIISPMPCRWALETNRGWFNERNVRVGSHVSGLDA
jgi:uncharacterized membrane protein (UPF0127 family)